MEDCRQAGASPLQDDRDAGRVQSVSLGDDISAGVYAAGRFDWFSLLDGKRQGRRISLWAVHGAFRGVSGVDAAVLFCFAESGSCAGDDLCGDFRFRFEPAYL